MSKEAMKLALEALEAMQSYAAAERKGLRICDEAITALREALAEQPAQQEPVGWLESPYGEFRANPLHKTVFPSSLLSWKIPLYAWHVRETNDGDELTIAYMSGLHRGKELALAEQPAQQEPVAWLVYAKGSRRYFTLTFDVDKVPEIYKGGAAVPLYTSPPAQRKPLTDEQIAKEVEAELTHYWNGEYIDTTGARDQLTAFARAIEAAHGIKENT